ncbi:hypothetical protein AURDEDRAFT_110474 [Auricularia subglabra TFB-10046 SS5]|nr:hypothetical protein AURDEDRAFT_110474 [Auricularia subglabra TFB-10046 SS5]
MEPPYLYPRKAMPRKFSKRKTYLYDRYRNIIDASTRGAPFLLLSHADFSANQLVRFRQEISDARPRGVKEPWVEDGGAVPQLEVITSTIFGVALREHPTAHPVGDTLSKATLEKGGSFAVLKLPSLNPPRLTAVLRSIDRFAAANKPAEASAAKGGKKADDDMGTPGRRPKRVRKRPGPKLAVLGAVIEGRVFQGPDLVSLSRLPDLDSMRAQLVGLLSTPASRIVGLLSEAGGAQLSRTLEGLKKSLEEDARAS